ncbi:MAG: endonuclease NucS [Thermodesulfobacteriota bacterium]|nr:endonuclease NucS [Thermodesulfobacteriota bacterium]
MLEAEMEKLLTLFPDELITPGVTLHSQQEIFPSGRTDLIFHDVEGNLLVVEVKASQLSRKHIGQIVEYWPQVKQRYCDLNIRLMVIAPDIPYERRAYLEHFQIEFREIPLHIFQTFQERATGRRSPETILQKEGEMPRPRKPNYNSATYKILNTVSRGLTTLSLKLREDLELPYYCVVWRDKRLESKSNRRFYLEKGAFWNMHANIAYEMLDEAHARGLLSSRYHRWPDRQFVVLDSSKLSQEEKKRLIGETLSLDDADLLWRNSADLRIVACCEPWGEEIWRKTMIVSSQANLITFRSITRAEYYKHKYSEVLLNGWQIDRSMIDADGFIHRTHFEALKEELGK